MTWRSNPLVNKVTTPPVAEAHGWVRGREFPPEFPLLDVAQAVPSYPPAEELARHVAEIAGQPSTSLYSDILGLPELRASLARHLSEDYAASVAAEQVAITSGCNQAYCVVVSALAGPGDEVILPLPYYFNHDMWLQMQGIRAVYLPFNAERPDRIVVEEVEALLTPRTHAMVLVSPNNPTGAEFPSEDIGALHELLVSRDVTLVIDETYKDFRSRLGPPHELLSRGAHTRPGFVQLYSFSKAYSMTGYRVGSIVCSSELLAEIEKILDCIAICPPRISQEAACYALANLDDWRDEKAQLMKERVQSLIRAFDNPALNYDLISYGAYFAYVRHPFEDISALDAARQLANRDNILCLPGRFFGPGQEQYLRFAFANVDADAIAELAGRLVTSDRND